MGGGGGQVSCTLLLRITCKKGGGGREYVKMPYLINKALTKYGCNHDAKENPLSVRNHYKLVKPKKVGNVSSL